MLMESLVAVLLHGEKVLKNRCQAGCRSRHVMTTDRLRRGQMTHAGICILQEQTRPDGRQA